MKVARNIKILAWFNFFIDFAFYLPVAILYFAKVAGSYALGMSIFSVVEVSRAALEVPTGIFSDMIGRKNTVVLGALAGVCSVVCYAIGGSYGWLVAGALLEGVGRSFYSGNNDALLHDSLHQMGTPDAYQKFYGKLQSLNQIGLAVIMLVGGIMASISFALVLWMSVIPKLVLFVLSLFLVEPDIHSQKSLNIFAHLGESLQQFKTNRKLRMLTLIDAIRFSLGEGGYLFRTAFVATLWPLWAVGLSNVISNIGAAVSFFFAGKILDRFGYKKILYFEIICNRILSFTALLFPTIFSPAIMGLTSLNYGSVSTAINTLFQKEFTQKERATLGSLSSFFGSLVFGVVAICLGYLGDKIGSVRTLLLVNVLLLGLIFLYGRLFREKRV